jgi:hypothetical protein
LLHPGACELVERPPGLLVHVLPTVPVLGCTRLPRHGWLPERPKSGVRAAGAFAHRDYAASHGRYELG